MSGLLSSDEIVAAKPWSQPSFSSSSFGGFPLAAAAANAVTQVIVEERLDERAAQVGASFLRQLSGLASEHAIVGAVRGRGLLLAIDLVAERGSPTPLAKSLREEIFQRCLRRDFDHGLFAAPAHQPTAVHHRGRGRRRRRDPRYGAG